MNVSGYPLQFCCHLGTCLPLVAPTIFAIEGLPEGLNWGYYGLKPSTLTTQPQIHKKNLSDYYHLILLYHTFLTSKSIFDNKVFEFSEL